jgi:hypothetical protein
MQFVQKRCPQNIRVARAPARYSSKQTEHFEFVASIRSSFVTTTRGKAQIELSVAGTTLGCLCPSSMLRSTTVCITCSIIVRIAFPVKKDSCMENGPKGKIMPSSPSPVDVAPISPLSEMDSTSIDPPIGCSRNLRAARAPVPATGTPMDGPSSNVRLLCARFRLDESLVNAEISRWNSSPHTPENMTPSPENAAARSNSGSISLVRFH